MAQPRLGSRLCGSHPGPARQAVRGSGQTSEHLAVPKGAPRELQKDLCERGYTGARCERVDLFYLRGDQGQIVIISLIVAIAALIILVVGICLCSHHCRRQRRKRKAEEMETLNKDRPSRSEDVRETGIA
ncbi:probetacellulin [Geospiza fortis]|uniref:Probetacellulin n=1 Tax=Geospiza fortis TaxID=48883 RepID=A0A6I9ZBQ2_GEOFO|nr:probetacellulin [Geospiza fortis]